MYSLLLALIYLAFISLGLPDSLLGTAWPVMHIELSAPLYCAGIVSMIVCAGTIVSSLLSERLTKRFGAKYVTVASVFLTSIGLFLFSISSELWHLCLIAIPYGLGAGSIDAALNNYVALHYTSRHMSWLHCFWGVGTIISPYVMSLALTYSSWNTGYRAVSIIQCVIGIILLATLGVWKINEQGGKDISRSDDRGRVIGIRGALKVKGVPYLLIGFFGYCAAEATVMLWTSSYLVEARGLSEQIAAGFTSLFFIGLTFGRFVSGIFADKLSDKALIRLGTVISVFGMLLVFIPAEADAFSLAGFLLIGLGYAPIYPSIIHSTPSNFGAENSQAIIGIQMASAYIGATFMPSVFGLIADFVSIKLLPIYMLLFTALMIIMIELTVRKVADNDEI